ncbi:hypothetical protein QBC47DRAFT_129026 [Echria macrotheca]|uniref:Uncharacterized protein n=1 Tax=Echria macrotheca TaxID=438768 RepID=A0AAJ0B4H9_9PEZI|nr:hypothetical protein QBC47DRAFT_129026 [Echria macrotheca]
MASIHPQDILAFCRQHSHDDNAWSPLTDNPIPRYASTSLGESTTTDGSTDEAAEYTTAPSSVSQSRYSQQTLYSMDPSSVFDRGTESVHSYSVSSAPSRRPRRPAFDEQFAVAAPPPPPPRLWCEFRDLQSCPFESDDFDEWVLHHYSGHLGSRLPTRSICWFCDYPFDVEAPASAAQRRHIFDRRMQHVASHIYDDEGLGIERMRPDFHMIQHIHRLGQLDAATYAKAMDYSELPDELRPPPEEPDYRSAGVAYDARPRVYDQAREDRRRRKEKEGKKRRR